MVIELSTFASVVYPNLQIIPSIHEFIINPKSISGLETMKLDDPISTIAMKPTETINQNETIGYAIRLMNKFRYRRFPVVNDAEQPVGMITTSDILSSMHQSSDFEFLSEDVRSTMSNKIIIASESDSIEDTIKLMYNMGISGIPIVRDKKIEGMFTEKDVIVYDKLWDGIPDQPITSEDGPGRPVSADTIITTDFTFWQVSDRFFKLAQRQILVKNEETNSFVGIMNILGLLDSVVNAITDQDEIPSLQTLKVSKIGFKPLYQQRSPTVISSARFWMNTRGCEAFPLFHRGKPVKLITEKDLVGYFASQI